MVTMSLLTPSQIEQIRELAQGARTDEASPYFIIGQLTRALEQMLASHDALGLSAERVAQPPRVTPTKGGGPSIWREFIVAEEGVGKSVQEVVEELVLLGVPLSEATLAYAGCGTHLVTVQYLEVNARPEELER